MGIATIRSTRYDVRDARIRGVGGGDTNTESTLNTTCEISTCNMQILMLA